MRLGKIANYGVSIEKVSEGLQAMEYDIAALEVVFNMFRRKPLDALLPGAAEKKVGVIARVPLASGLLTGRYTGDTVFGPKDHRSYNREGASFDKGETFSGVPYELGLEAVEALILNSHKKIEKCSEWELRQTRRRTQMGWRPSRTTTQYGTIPAGTD